MAIAYTEFDTTMANMRDDVVTKILLSTDWTDVTPTQPSTTIGTGTASNNATIIVASATGFYVGMHLTITQSSNVIYRYVTAISGTSITLNATPNTFGPASGNAVVGTDKVVKAITTRGAHMVLGLGYVGGWSGGTGYVAGLHVVPFRSSSATGTGGATPADPGDNVPYTARYIFLTDNFSASTTTTYAVHGLVSSGKEHVFIRLEGPRYNETGAINATYGSPANSVFMCDVVPYHAGDSVACVAWGGGAMAVLSNSVFVNAEYTPFLFVSRNKADNASWVLAKLPTLNIVSNYGLGSTGEVYKINRTCTIDGNEYMWPYVVVQEAEGLRGRLARFHFIGMNTYSNWKDVGEPLGELNTFSGVTYKYQWVHRTGVTGANYVATPFGLFSGTTTNSNVSPIVAIPYS